LDGSTIPGGNKVKPLKTGIVCVGCGKDSGELEEYNEDDPVEQDGTFANGMFVCTECYVELIPLGLDVGTAEEIQQRTLNLTKESAELILKQRRQNEIR